MKALPLTFFVLMLAIACGAKSGETVADEVLLFADDDYRFTVVDWKVEHSVDGKKKVVVRLSYQIPLETRFIVSVAKHTSDMPVGELALEELYEKIMGKGHLSLAFDDPRPGTLYHFLLWRGVGGQSPSGLVCDAAFLDLTPRVQLSFLHKKKPNKSPEPTPTAVTPRATEPKSK